MSTIHADINANRFRGLSQYLRQGTSALKTFNPKDDRTHPAVRRIIAERGERAGFLIKDGALFQLTTGLGETKGVGSYFPVRGCSLAETSRIAQIFDVTEPEVVQVIFGNRS
jgi:hypothetical protein